MRLSPKIPRMDAAGWRQSSAPGRADGCVGLLNWISRSAGSVTAPFRMPENSTPYFFSKVCASETKYSEFIFIAYGWLRNPTT